MLAADELVERVARAICATAGDDWEREGPGGLPAYIDQARAAIRAVHDEMREPDAAMLKAGDARLYREEAPEWINENSRLTWRAMLAAHPIAEVARDE